MWSEVAVVSRAEGKQMGRPAVEQDAGICFRKPSTKTSNGMIFLQREQVLSFFRHEKKQSIPSKAANTLDLDANRAVAAADCGPDADDGFDML
jgi:hypothetical protein